MEDKLLERKHRNEQDAYLVMREALVEEFIHDPVSFVVRFGKRPEDFTGEDLRTLYPNCLVQGIEPGPRFRTDPGFIRRFVNGELFGGFTMQGMHGA